MLKVLFVYIGKLMLAGAYGWKRASELSLYAHVGATLYFDAWVLCLLFCGIESKDQILSIVISILFPLLYIAFVAFIRIKNKKLKKHETVQPDNAIEESPSEASKPISDADIKTCLKENTEVTSIKRKFNAKQIAILCLSFCLIVSLILNITYIFNQQSSIDAYESSIQQQKETNSMLISENSLLKDDIEEYKINADYFNKIKNFIETYVNSDSAYQSDIITNSSVYIVPINTVCDIYLNNNSGSPTRFNFTQNDIVAIRETAKNTSCEYDEIYTIYPRKIGYTLCTFRGSDELPWSVNTHQILIIVI